MMLPLFNFYYFKVKISPDLYNKSELMSKMLKNYEKSPSRNKWNKFSDMHHEIDDLDNKDLEKINYEQIAPVYQEIIQSFVDKIPTVKSFNWNYEIVNYTVTKNIQNMISHHHIPSTFSAVHYLKFNPSLHKSTIFTNPSTYRSIFDLLYADHWDFLDSKDPRNFWISPFVELDVEEDDIIIFPSILDHNIAASYSDEERVTISININFSKKN